MVRQSIVAAVVVAGLVSGCAREATPPEPEKAERKPTVLDDQLKALEKAKGVQQELDEAARKRDAAAEEQGG